MTQRAIFLLVALAVAAPAPTSAQQISARASLGAPAKAEIALAKVAEPLEVPVKAGENPLVVAHEFCGVVSRTYRDLLKDENGGDPSVLAVSDTDRTLRLPACFFLRPKGEAIRAEGETLSEFSERVLGPSGPKSLQALRNLNGPLDPKPSSDTATLMVPYRSIGVVYNLKPEAANDPQAAVDSVRDAFPEGQYSAVELSQVATAEPGDLRPMSGIVKRIKVTCDHTVPQIASEAWPIDIEAVNAALARNRAWRKANGSESVFALVAVADNGIDLANNVFADALLAPNLAEPKNNKDDDGNNKVDDIIGVSLYSNDPPELAPMGMVISNGHGTLMTSAALGGPKLTAAALTDGATVRVLVINMLQRREKPTSVSYGYPATGLAEALRYATYRGAQVINFSVGTVNRPNDLLDLLLKEEPQRVIVAAAGNEAWDYGVASQFPAVYGGKEGRFSEQVVTVAAHDQWGCLADFSGRGPIAVDVAAPGVAFPATGPKGRILTLDGTSQAAALTTYTIGQMKAEGLLVGSRAKDRLYATAIRSAQLGPYVASGGRLDIAQAISVHHDILKTVGGVVEYGVLEEPINLLALCPSISDSTGGDILRVDVAPGAAQMSVLWRTSDGRRSLLPPCTPAKPPTAFGFTPEGGTRRAITWASVEYLIPH